MNSNYKVNIKDIQNKYTFKIFCAGADTTEIEQEVAALDTRVDTLETNITNKEDKSNKVTTLSNTSTDTQYPSAKCVYDSQTLQDEKVETLETSLQETQGELENAQKELDLYKTIYNALPKVSGTGESLTLNDTANAVMKNKLYPQMEQDSTTGKNLLEDVSLTTEITTRGVTFTPVYKENGELEYININGTPTTNFATDINTRGTRNPLIFTQETQVICSGTTTGSSSTYRFVYNYYDSGGTENAGAVVSTEEKTFTYPANSTIHAYIYVFSGATINNVRVYPMIRLATIQDGTYEPYTNGASPNPSYPQPIHTISGDNAFKFVGKNLFDKNNVTDGKRIGQDGKDYDDVDYYISSYISVSQNTQYTKNSPIADAYHRFAFYESQSATSLISVSSDNTITTPNNCNYLRFCGLKTEKDTTMLVQGTTIGEYEPYQSQNKPLNLGDLEYNAIGDYKDEFVKVDGKWFLRKNIQKVIFDGTENWQSYNDYVYMGTNFERGIDNIGYCDKAPFSSSNLQYTSTAKTGIQAKNLVSYWGLSDTTVTTWKNYLANDNLILYYPLATSQDILLNDTLQEQIEDIYNQTLSYQGQTNISQVNNDLAFIVESSALKDMSDNA